MRDRNQVEQVCSPTIASAGIAILLLVSVLSS